MKFLEQIVEEIIDACGGNPSSAGVVSNILETESIIKLTPLEEKDNKISVIIAIDHFKRELIFHLVEEYRGKYEWKPKGMKLNGVALVLYGVTFLKFRELIHLCELYADSGLHTINNFNPSYDVLITTREDK